jgi:hypothetical protein
MAFMPKNIMRIKQPNAMGEENSSILTSLADSQHN